MRQIAPEKRIRAGSSAHRLGSSGRSIKYVDNARLMSLCRSKQVDSRKVWQGREFQIR